MTFWLSLPGFLTAVATLIAALVGAGIIRGMDPGPEAATPQGDGSAQQVDPRPEEDAVSPDAPSSEADATDPAVVPEGGGQVHDGAGPFRGLTTFTETLSPGFGVDLDRGAVPLEGYDVTGFDLTFTPGGLDLSGATAAALAPGANHPDDCPGILATRSDPVITVGQLSSGPVLLCLTSSANTALVLATYAQVPGAELVDLVYAYTTP